MRAPITDKHLLEMMWERFPEIMKRGAEQPAQQQEPVTKDAEEWGGRLNDASWSAIAAWNTERMGPMSGAVFNNIKGVVRAAILKYLEVHTSPPAQRTWVGLQDDEIYSVLENLQVMHHRPPTTDSRVIFARAIEAKLKEKNT